MIIHIFIFQVFRRREDESPRARLHVSITENTAILALYFFFLLHDVHTYIYENIDITKNVGCIVKKDVITIEVWKTRYSGFIAVLVVFH